MLQDLEEWFSRKEKEIKKDYFHFLRFRSISADPADRKEVLDCAKWLSEYMEKKGLAGRLLPTKGYPIVFGEMRSAKSDAKTVLLYGHYDVQPVDPLELWKSNPFEPVEREGRIFARGASDDKGQIFYAVQAIIACKELGIKLPVHVKFCIEGEEESQSRGLMEGLEGLKSQLSADALLVVDFSSPEKQPAVALGARGMAGMEVKLRGSAIDLHSGMAGGIAYNPNRALAELLASCWDKEGRVQIPGFYDDVLKEREDAYDFSHTREEYETVFGIQAFGGERGRSLKEANWLRPTLEINGMWGGYTGEGLKTVIPAEAFAKLTMRLVPNQDPDQVLASLERFLKERCVKGMEIGCVSHGGERAWRGSADSRIAQAVCRAAEKVCRAPCKRELSGASIPVIAKMVETLGCDVAGMGYALDSDQIHAPNEHFDFVRFKKGLLTVAYAMIECG